MSDRFFTPEPLTLGETILDGPEAHHLIHVRRFEASDSVTLFNGDGREYHAKITSVGKRQVNLNVTDVEEPHRELGFILHIGAALPKGDRGDFLIAKLTELGVTDFTPLVTTRGIVHMKDAKVEKLHRAVIEASKQCGRNVLMRIHPPLRVAAWCGSTELPSQRWIAIPEGKPPRSAMELTRAVAAAIGPEGGFTKEEVEAAGQSGFEAISLGPRILRVETAALAIAAILGIGRATLLR